ncbi:unnamed protein product [Peniophora sp. CBMAI 1063]|nr:unnamed protein product [Peniophora sp. CBMAI 1063]
MASPPHRRLSSSGAPSHSMLGSTSRSMHQSRPFLNLINPMGHGHNYAGYTAANQSVLEEEAEEEEEDDEMPPGSVRLERSRHERDVEAQQAPKALSASVFRPNVLKDDRLHDTDDGDSDGEVPQSFMIESPALRHKSIKSKGKARARPPPPPPVAPRVSVPPRPSELEPEYTPHDLPDPVTAPQRLPGLDAKEQALWQWVNVYNLDAFLQEVYLYYEGKGMYSIALARGLNLLTIGFVIGFSTFLLRCVDYARIRPEEITRLGDVVVPRCVARFSGFTLLFFALFCAFYAWQVVSFVLATKRLLDIYNFYTHLLGIPDEDIQTIAWPEVVRRIAAIRDSNPVTALSSGVEAHVGAKLDAHDIANRIMRQENYLIALFNKELLDLRVPLPGSLSRLGIGEEGKGRTLTRALEWNLRFCLLWYLFDSRGRVRKVFLKSRNRAALIEGLRRRFVFMGILNAIFAPFIVLYLIMYSFFRYFDEYHKNPSNIGGRAYTPFAQWKFREFNELPHLFKRRLDESYPIATAYIAQFPNEKVAIVMRFVAFIAGSFAAVLLLASVLDPDLFLHFEITPHRTVLFYLTAFGGILAVARGMIPEDNRVYDASQLMVELVNYTHYLPAQWKSKYGLHSKAVHAEFGQLFQMKVLTFVTELASVILTPFILWHSLPPCAPALVDFFREFTVHVDGLGFVCSFAVFDFERHGNVRFGAPGGGARDKRHVSKDGKMEQSFIGFTRAHPEWVPNDRGGLGSVYLERLQDRDREKDRRRSSKLAPHAGTPPATSPARTAQTLQPEDRAQEYEHALMQSQALARRRGGGLGASSVFMGPPRDMAASGMYTSAMAQTAVLGDSGTLPEVNSPSTATASPRRGAPAELAVDELEGEGSYVDGAQRKSVSQDIDDAEEEELRDGGVIGLLAQIYSGPAKGRGTSGPGRGL